MAEDQDRVPPEMIDGDPAVELSSNRTAMSFERTAMSSDRTLMSVVRTSLSMISFGFTIYQVLRAINSKVLVDHLPVHAPRNFGLMLIILGVVMLALGIGNHVHETRLRRARRKKLHDLGLIRQPEINKMSTTMIVAILLLLLGVAAILSVGFSLGPL